MARPAKSAPRFGRHRAIEQLRQKYGKPPPDYGEGLAPIRETLVMLGPVPRCAPQSFRDVNVNEIARLGQAILGFPNFTDHFAGGTPQKHYDGGALREAIRSETGSEKTVKSQSGVPESRRNFVVPPRPSALR